MEKTAQAGLVARIDELLSLGETERALALCQERIDANASDDGALASAGFVCLVRSDYEQAISLLRRAVRASPGTQAHWGNLGVGYLLKGDTKRAVRLLAKACGTGAATLFSRELRLAYRRRAADLYLEGNWALAARDLQRILREDPVDAITWSDLGALYASIGRVHAGLRCFRRAVDIDPENIFFRSNLAVALNYRNDLSSEQIRDAHIALFRSLDRPAALHPNDPTPYRKLRVGYFSGDFRFSPPAFFLPPVLRSHDRSGFDIFCYSNTEYEDEYTMKMKCLADHWRDVQPLDDRRLAELIRADGIDILIDRTGHFERGRPGLFSLTPAPVQVSLPGYPATTGVPGITHRITDSFADPPGMTDHLHTEKLIRLPYCFACYAPADRSPEVAPLPALAAGYITFGCFQKREKITAQMLGLWACILQAVHESRLMFHHLFSGIHNIPSEFRRGIETLLRKRGVGQDRLIWVGSLQHYDHLKTMSQVDIALDTYPYNGMTTTCECLWMGVPVVTRAGTAHVSRVGLSYLSNVGLRDWVAASDQEYVEIAVRQASDLGKLDLTRRHLRGALLTSALTDAATYTRCLEAAFRTMWREYCERGRERTM